MRGRRSRKNDDSVDKDARVIEGMVVKRMGRVLNPTTTMRRMANLCDVRDLIICH